MVIIYLHQYFALPSSAGGTRSYDLAKRFTVAGHRVIVVTTSAFLKNIPDDKKNWLVINHEEIELHILRLRYSNNMTFMMRVLVFFKFFLYASIKLLKIKGDVVLATSTPLTIAIPAIVKKAFHKTPFIFEVRDVWPEVPVAMGIIKNPIVINLLKRFEKFVYSKAAHIVALSPDMKVSIQKQMNSSHKKITVITNIAVIERFSDFNTNDKLLTRFIGITPGKIVLYAGTVGMVNGLKTFVDMAYYSLTYDPIITFVIFGDGMEKEDLKNYAETKKVLNKNLFFCDPVSKSTLPQLYFECTVAASFVIPVPELWANSANKFFDCLAAGRPILINHRGWQAEIIEKENIGFVIDFNVENIQKEAHRFCNYINDAPRVEKQGFNARALAENFSLDAASAKYLKILSDVSSQKPG